MKQHKFLVLIITCVLIFTLAGIATAHTNPSYTINWWTISGGGGPKSGGNYKVNGIVGQPNTDEFQGGPFVIRSGFWAKSELETEGSHNDIERTNTIYLPTIMQ